MVLSVRLLQPVAIWEGALTPMMIWRVKSLKTGTIEAPMPRGGCTKYVLQAQWIEDGPPRIINTVPGAKVEAFLSDQCGGGIRNCPMMIWRVKSLKTGTIEAPMPRGGCTKLAVTRTRKWSKPPRPAGPRQ